LGFVSIPSEVGRGRETLPQAVLKSVLVSFQSPRRWGGVGLPKILAHLGLQQVKFQSPRRWGGVGLG